MKIAEICMIAGIIHWGCNEYFSQCKVLRDSEKSSCCQKVAAFIIIGSYFTLVIPAIVAIVMGINYLIGRCSYNESSDPIEDVKNQDIKSRAHTLFNSYNLYSGFIYEDDNKSQQDLYSEIGPALSDLYYYGSSKRAMALWSKKDDLIQLKTCYEGDENKKKFVEKLGRIITLLEEVSKISGQPEV